MIYRFLERLTEFGYTPTKLFARMKPGGKSVLANSIPKSGTNLLMRLLYLLPEYRRRPIRTLSESGDRNTDRSIQELRKWEFVMGHLKYSEQLLHTLLESGTKHILMIRDPRDIAISNYRYITDGDNRHRLHDYYKTCLSTDEDRLMASINGIPAELLGDNRRALSLAEHFRAYLPWFKEPSCLIVRFEDLVGERGGGDNGLQVQCLENILGHLDYDLSAAERSKLADALFSTSSRTFHKGQIGAWRRHSWDQSLIAEKTDFDDMIGAMGYEPFD